MERKHEAGKDLATGAVLCFAAVAYLYFSTDIRVFTGLGATGMSARTMPLIYGVLLLVLSLYLLIRGGVRARKAAMAARSAVNAGETAPEGAADAVEPEEGAPEEAEQAVSVKAKPADGKLLGWLLRTMPIWGTVLLLLLYILLMETLGFLLATVIYVFAQIQLMTPPGKRRWLVPGIIAVASSVTIYVLFIKLMKLLLPTGIFYF